MLSEATYIEQLAHIMAWYPNFNFKIYDIDSGGKKQKSLQYTTWYKAFSNFSDEDFSKVVDGYCNDNTYPPSSPTSILEYAKTRLIQEKKGEIDKVWVDLKDMMAQHGFKGYKTYSKKIDDYIIIYPLEQALKKYNDKKLLTIYKNMYSRLSTLTINSEPFVRKEFFEEYERLIVEEAKNNVNQGKLELGKDDKLKLGEGK